MLPEPPAAWTAPYAALARDDQLNWTSIAEAFDAARKFLDPVLAGDVVVTWGSCDLVVVTEMTTQRNSIVEALVAQGWQQVETLDGEWWADEILVLRSEWSLVGTLVYLTFLVDPLHDGQRGPGEAVWAVAATRERPTDRASAESEPLLTLGSDWRERLLDFISAMNAFRAPHELGEN